MVFRRERLSSERHVRTEFDHARRTACGRASFDLPVCRVQHITGLQPLWTEGKHVFVGICHVPVTDHQAAVAAVDRVKRDGAVRSEGWRREGAGR